MAFAEDFSVFFDTGDFAVNASFTPRTGGSPVAIKGIFDREYMALSGVGEMAVAVTQPAFMTASSSIPNARGGTLTIDAVTYRIVEVKQDGTGVTALMLEDQS